MSITRKIWGIKHRLIENDLVEVDLLYLTKDRLCSLHNHEKKINRFILISGDVEVETELGAKKLVINEPFDVEPPMVHRFIVNEDSVMIEIAYVNDGKIDNNDIDRRVQGGVIMNDRQFFPLDKIETTWKF